MEESQSKNHVRAVLNSSLTLKRFLRRSQKWLQTRKFIVLQKPFVATSSITHSPFRDWSKLTEHLLCCDKFLQRWWTGEAWWDEKLVMVETISLLHTCHTQVFHFAMSFSQISKISHHRLKITQKSCTVLTTFSFPLQKQNQSVKKFYFTNKTSL